MSTTAHLSPTNAAAAGSRGVWQGRMSVAQGSDSTVKKPGYLLAHGGAGFLVQAPRTQSQGGAKGQGATEGAEAACFPTGDAQAPFADVVGLRVEREVVGLVVQIPGIVDVLIFAHVRGGPGVV